MTEDEIVKLCKLEWMASRIPKRDALAAFVSDDGVTCPAAVHAASQKAPSRWYPEPGGLRVLILYEGGDYDSETFQLEPEGWDHEECDVCGGEIPSMTPCHVAKCEQGFALCEVCFQKHVGKSGSAA